VTSQLPQRIDDINPTLHAIATRPDLRAAEWIRENTSLDDRFLVNSVFAYDNNYIVGSDGGWWLPLLTKRLTTQPPLNYGDEEGFIPNNVAWVNQIPQAILSKGLTDPSVMSMLRERGVTFVYLGQLHKREVPPVPLLDSTVLQDDPHFQLVYRKDEVWIFKISY
jgi:hypothetical protein